MLLLSIGCPQNYEITTWNKWRDHLTDHALNKRYNLPKIREDFIKVYIEILVKEMVSNHFGIQLFILTWEWKNLLRSINLVSGCKVITCIFPIHIFPMQALRGM